MDEFLKKYVELFHQKIFSSMKKFLKNNKSQTVALKIKQKKNLFFSSNGAARRVRRSEPVLRRWPMAPR